MSEYRVSSIQNAMSAAVFGVLLTAQLSAFLLHLNPRSEWLWFLSVKMNRISDPVLPIYDKYVSVGPLLSCALLALLCATPIFAQARRSWLGAFLLGHLALLVCIASAADELEQASIHYDYASLDSVVNAATLNWSTITAVAATAAFLIICPLNQFFHIRAYRARRAASSQHISHSGSCRCICAYSFILCHLLRLLRKFRGLLAAQRARLGMAPSLTTSAQR